MIFHVLLVLPCLLQTIEASIESHLAKPTTKATTTTSKNLEPIIQQFADVHVPSYEQELSSSSVLFYGHHPRSDASFYSESVGSIPWLKAPPAQSQSSLSPYLSFSMRKNTLHPSLGPQSARIVNYENDQPCQFTNVAPEDILAHRNRKPRRRNIIPDQFDENGQSIFILDDKIRYSIVPPTGPSKTIGKFTSSIKQSSSAKKIPSKSKPIDNKIA